MRFYLGIMSDENKVWD